MTKPSIPSLDMTGWVEGIAQSADKLFAYFLTSDKSQSNIYQVHSFPFLIQKFTDRPRELEEGVQSALRALYSLYFDDVSVTVKVVPYKEDDSKLDVRINMTIRSGEYQYSLGRLISSVNKAISSVTTLEV